MMRSLYSGISGLRNHQTRMDVIGNNIANVNTIGYKTSRVTFQDIFSQTAAGGTANLLERGLGDLGGTNPIQIGLGIKLGTIDVLHTPAPMARTDNPFDMMIEGDGYFIVQNENGDNFYTRAGNFYLDDEGYLVTSHGYFVMSYTADLMWMAPEFIIEHSDATPPLASVDVRPGSRASVGVGLLNDQELQRVRLRVPSETVDSVYAKYREALGNPTSYDTDWETFHQWLTPVLTTTGTGGLSVEDKNSILAWLASPGTSEPPAVTPVIPTTITGMTDAEIEAYFSIYRAAVTNNEQLPGTTPGTGGPAGPIAGSGLDTGDFVDLMGFSVGQDGSVSVIIDNIKKTIAYLGIGMFSNPGGLEKAGNSLYRESPSSGAVVETRAMMDGAGRVNGGGLEMSNVDLASEFTDMIVTQRGFQANSRIITVSDTMLEELVNLKR